jgi:hypothetical protein
MLCCAMQAKWVVDNICSNFDEKEQVGAAASHA